MLLALVRESAAAGCPRKPARLAVADFALGSETEPPSEDAPTTSLTLPDAWRARRPGVGGFGRYRLALPPAEDGARRCAVYLPDVNMNAAVFVNGHWIGDGGSLEEPVAHNFSRPLYFTFPSALLNGRDDHVDVLLYAYPHHFGRLGRIWVGGRDALVGRHDWTYFRQITLAQIGTGMAVVTVRVAMPSSSPTSATLKPFATSVRISSSRAVRIGGSSLGAGERSRWKLCSR
ncbi:MAG TPA: hypothetical protein VIS07_23155 [Candidatus Binatia bacterium]